MNHDQTWWTSLVQAVGLCALSGATVALVLQDVTVLLPFVVAVPAATAALHALARVRAQVLRRLAVALVVAGVVAVAHGRFISADGTVQALGVLGGASVTAAGVALYAIVQLTRRASRSRTPAGRSS